MSAKAKVLAYLSKEGSYNTLTAQKMQSVFGVANPSATINELRNEGHTIYLNSRINSNGDKVSFYRLRFTNQAYRCCWYRCSPFTR
jgi:hypothetical protein